MKKLQNNFTTPELSKRLLELGVPADSADCYYGKDGKIHHIDGSIPNSLLWTVGCIPCWSAGRLIEIYNECCKDMAPLAIGKYDIPIQRVLIEFSAALKYEWIDLSILEE